MAEERQNLKSSTISHNSIVTYHVKFFDPLGAQQIANKPNKAWTALGVESELFAK